MGAYALIGAQWGDEGKGKVVDYLASKAQWVARYAGGNNAGHTVMNEGGTFSLHLVPSGIFQPEVSLRNRQWGGGEPGGASGGDKGTV